MHNVDKTYVTAVVIGISGLVLIGMNAGWLTALGAFLFVWGNNMDVMNRDK